MKTKFKLSNRILSLVLAFVTALGMMPMTVHASETKVIYIGELSLYDQYTVDGVTAIDGVPDDSVTSYAHWNWATTTLTLKNYTQTITARADTTNSYYGIDYYGNVNLVLIGDNTINVEAPNTDAQGYTYGIWCHKDLTITGDGSLTISSPSYAFFSNNNITINCTGKIKANANYSGYGLRASKTVDIQQGTLELYGSRSALSANTLNIANADVKAFSNEAPIGISNDITIKDSSVKAVCNWATSYTAYNGIESSFGSIIIENSQVEAKRSNGIYGNGVSISDSTVTVTSTKAAFNNVPSVNANKSAVWYGTDSTVANEAGARPISELSTNYTQKYVRIAPYDHTHNWAYFADSNTITATCNAAGCFNANGGSVTLEVSDAYYTGSAIGVTVTGSFTNGATYKVTYNGSETAPSSVGTHTAKLTVYENGTEKQSVTAQYKISYLPAPNPAYAISGHNYYDKTNKVYWFVNGVAVTVNAPVGYEISKTLHGTYGQSVSFLESDDKVIYLKRVSDGVMTDAIEVEGIGFDANAPMGKITIENRGFWEKLLNKITFGLFFKGDMAATVVYMDADSGVKSVEYYVSDEDLLGDDMLDSAEAVTRLENAIGNNWNTYNDEISLTNNAKNIIYVKITDNVGNVTYISSDGIVLDNIAPSVYGIEDGGVYYGDKIFKATDDNFLKIEVDGVDITDTTEGDNEFKILADNAEHTVTVTDKAGNVTEYKIAVYKRYTVNFIGEDEAGGYEKEFKYGQVITIPTNEIFEETFRRSGYTLTGWQGYTEGMTMPLENLTFVAVYVPNQYTVSFDTNGGEEIDPITVTYGEKYGDLPSSAITGLSGGNSNWYLVDRYGNVTDTKITKLSEVSQSRNHTLVVKRNVLAPSVKLNLSVPGGISDNYQYYIPGNSARILTATVSNRNDEVLNYTYQWYKDDKLIAGEANSTLTLVGNVADSGTYKVEVTATLKGGTNIVVTSDSATDLKEQQVKILHAANTLYYDANGGEDGPQSSYTGGTSLSVSKDLPTREHYDFVGWSTKPDGSGEEYKAEDIYTFADDGGNGGCVVTLYAQWKLKEYTVTYTADGETISTEKVEYGKDATLPAVPKKEGYVGKWDADGKNIIGDTTITAVYMAIPALNPDEVKLEDKDALEDAKEKLEEELKDDAYTDEDKKVIQDAIDSIDKALEVISNVEEVLELIDKLPDTITKDDESAIKTADDAYNTLTDYEKSLVGEDAKKALEDAKAVLAELNEPASSPQTGDNSNLWMWFALLFVSGAGIFGITLSRCKTRAKNKQ